MAESRLTVRPRSYGAVTAQVPRDQPLPLKLQYGTVPFLNTPEPVLVGLPQPPKVSLKPSDSYMHR